MNGILDLDIDKGDDKEVSAPCEEYRSKVFRIIHLFLNSYDLARFWKKYASLFDPIRVSLKRIIYKNILKTCGVKQHCCLYVKKYFILLQELDTFIRSYESQFEPIRTELRLILDGIGQIDDESADVNCALPEEIPVFEMDPNLSLRVLSTAELIRKIVEYLNKPGTLAARHINPNWNAIIVSSHSQRHRFEAECMTGYMKILVRETDEVQCACDMSLVETSLSDPFPIRRYKLGFAWKDHLRKLTAFDNVEIDSLDLIVPVVGHEIFNVPLNPDFVEEEYHSTFNIDETVTSLPANLEWLDGSLPMISSVLSPRMFQNLTELYVCLTTHEFYVRRGESNMFTDDFYRTARECVLRNSRRLNYRLNCLKTFVLKTFNDWGVVGSQFMSLAGSIILKGVCLAASNLTHLDIEGWFPTIDSICLPNLTRFSVWKYSLDQTETNSITEMLERCKSSNPKFSLTHLRIRYLEGTVDATELLNFIGDSIENLGIKSPVDSADLISTTRWPIMPRLTTFTANWYTLNYHKLGDFDEKMPGLKEANIECDYNNARDMYLHPLVPNFLTGEISAIPENFADPPLQVTVSSFNLQRLVLERDRDHRGVCLSIPIKWNCVQVTSLTLMTMGCITELLDIIQQFPSLSELDVTVMCDSPCSDADTKTSYADFIFTGLPFQELYSTENAIEKLACAVSSEMIPLEERRKCLLQRTSLKHLTVRHGFALLPSHKDKKMISDWAGFHGFALMTHLETFTLESRFYFYTENESTRPTMHHVLSEECMDFVRKALEPTTRVSFEQKLIKYNDFKPPPLGFGF